MLETNIAPGGHHKSGMWGVLTALLVLLMVLSAVLIAERGYKLFTSFGGVEPSKTLPVTAEGKVKAVPDVAIISLGVVTQADTAREAQSKSTEAINKVTDFVKDLGVADEDITTTNNGVYQRYEWKENTNQIVGYEASNQITVKVRGVDKAEGKDIAGKITVGAVDNGANQVYGSQFVIDNSEDLVQQAKILAIEKARDKAEELAKAAGIKIGKVVNVSESSGYYPMPMYADTRMGMAEGGYGGGAAPQPYIEPGQQEITQQVTVLFEIK